MEGRGRKRKKEHMIGWIERWGRSGGASFFLSQWSNHNSSHNKNTWVLLNACCTRVLPC